MTGFRLSTHVLDAARGRPAAGVPVRWESRDVDGAWVLAGIGTTDADGRIGHDAWRLPVGATAAGGDRHRLVFDVEDWAGAEGLDTFFPEVTITFAPAGADRYHVPLLLSPFAYSTYRGS